MTGIVCNIQRYSLHDGPGIRTVVFLKGCPLRCRWCCNPETQNPLPEPMRQNGRESTVGQTLPAEEIIEIAQRDELFQRGGGGLTLSGGEPLGQGDFTLDVLRRAKEERIHTAMETAGYGDYAILRAACARLDYLLFDVKSLDDAKHKDFTGVGNTLILKNLVRLCEEFPRLPKRIRTPVIPGFNENETASIAAFAARLPNAVHEALPYHRFGATKYAALGRAYPMEQTRQTGIPAAEK
jgi:pyruvate formate lyase activating enzyme